MLNRVGQGESTKRHTQTTSRALQGPPNSCLLNNSAEPTIWWKNLSPLPFQANYEISICSNAKQIKQSHVSDSSIENRLHIAHCISLCWYRYVYIFRFHLFCITGIVKIFNVTKMRFASFSICACFFFVKLFSPEIYRKHVKEVCHLPFTVNSRVFFLCWQNLISWYSASSFRSLHNSVSNVQVAFLISYNIDIAESQFRIKLTNTNWKFHVSNLFNWNLYERYSF